MNVIAAPAIVYCVNGLNSLTLKGFIPEPALVLGVHTKHQSCARGWFAATAFTAHSAARRTNSNSLSTYPVLITTDDDKA